MKRLSSHHVAAERHTGSSSAALAAVSVAVLTAATVALATGCDREHRGAGGSGEASAASSSAMAPAAPARPEAATVAPPSAPTAEERAAALAAAERAADGDVYVAQSVTLGKGWTWTERYSSLVELDLAIGGRQQLGLRTEEDDRKIEVLEITDDQPSAVRVTYGEQLYRMDYNTKQGKPESPLAGKTYIVKQAADGLEHLTAAGAAPSDDELEALERRKPHFGKRDAITRAVQGVRFPRDFEVEMPPADFATPMGQFQLAPERVVMIYRGMEKGGARFELRATMLGDNASMKLRVENHETMLLDATGWRLAMDQRAEIRADGGVVGRGTTKIQRAATPRIPPKRGK